MSREVAHQILDDAKAGKPIPEATILLALRITGDLRHQWPAEEEE